MTDAPTKFPIRLIRCGLLLGTLFLFYPVVHYPYITYDDYAYLDVRQVKAGLTWPGIGWSFTTGLTGNWHPLTWISHMVDCQLFGLANPGAHHLVNLLFHIANTLLLFELWRRITGAVWRSAMLAALFAWHPLHVESVAWVAERKDVLSAFFFFLTLLAYARFAEEARIDSPKRQRWYVLALILFALGLMAKPMLVTLPFVLLLLDFWPLRRFSFSSLGVESADRGWVRPGFPKLLLEKIPFLFLSIASCVITYLVQQKGGNMKATANLSFGERAGTAILGYAAYLKKAFWPVDLAVFYPYPPRLPRIEVLVGASLLVVISAAAFALARSRPYFFAGWFWFLGMLVPVIGVVTVGAQAYADRYTYLPLIGIFFAVIWGAQEFIFFRPGHKIIPCAAAAAILLVCAALTRRQVGYWQNSLALFNHAAHVTRDNPVVENNLGVALDAAGKLQEAEHHYETSLKLVPDFTETWHFLGVNLAAQGNYRGAIECYEQQLRLGDQSAVLQYNYGNALAALGDLTNAFAHYSASVALDPDFPQARNNLGALLLKSGRLDDARVEFETALRLQPDYPQAQDQLGHVFLKLGQPAKALSCFRQAVAESPTLADAQLQLGFILASQDSLQEALGPLQAAVKLEPKNALAVFTLGALYDALQQYDRAADSFAVAFNLNPKNADAATRLGGVLAKLGKFPEAIDAYRQALALDSNAVPALQGLAWMLATSPVAELRNGAEAVRLARRAVELTGRKQPLVLSALDAALAESGQFEEAIRVAQETAALARAQQQNEIANQTLARLEVYKSQKPWRESGQ